MGSAFGLYDVIPGYDKILHFIGGIIWPLLAVAFIDLIGGDGEFDRLSPAMFFTYILFFTIALGVVLTLVQTKQIRINIHKRNNTKTQYKQYKTQ
jgi:hypothetical protein